MRRTPAPLRCPLRCPRRAGASRLGHAALDTLIDLPMLLPSALRVLALLVACGRQSVLAG
jgi:ABC-type sulfate transport system permease component